MKILTGDNEVVTRKICHEVGLDAGDILLGAKIGAMTDDELADIAEQTTVFAKLDSRAEGTGRRARCTPRATSSAFSATASTTARR